MVYWCLVRALLVSALLDFFTVNLASIIFMPCNPSGTTRFNKCSFNQCKASLIRSSSSRAVPYLLRIKGEKKKWA